jgi:hypothetical protein
VLALRLLWAALDDEMEAYMPARVLRYRIRAAYETIRQLELEVNPVKKILCVVTGFEAEVHIDEISEMDLEGGNDWAQQARLGRYDVILEPFTLNTLQCEENSGSSEPNCSNTIRRIAIQPARRVANLNSNNNDDAAKLKSGVPLCRARPVISIRFGMSTSLGLGVGCLQLRRGAKSSIRITDGR